MGLGKTVQAIGMIAYLAEQKASAGSKSLVVAPKSVMSNWLKEFAKWLPSLRVLHIGGTKEVDLSSFNLSFSLSAPPPIPLSISHSVCVCAFSSPSLSRVQEKEREQANARARVCLLFARAFACSFSFSIPHNILDRCVCARECGCARWQVRCLKRLHFGRNFIFCAFRFPFFLLYKRVHCAQPGTR